MALWWCDDVLFVEVVFECGGHCGGDGGGEAEQCGGEHHSFAAVDVAPGVCLVVCGDEGCGVDRAACIWDVLVCAADAADVFGDAVVDQEIGRVLAGFWGGDLGDGGFVCADDEALKSGGRGALKWKVGLANFGGV